MTAPAIGLSTRPLVAATGALALAAATLVPMQAATNLTPTHSPDFTLTASTGMDGLNNIFGDIFGGGSGGSGGNIFDALGFNTFQEQLTVLLNALNPSALLAPGGFDHLIDAIGFLFNPSSATAAASDTGGLLGGLPDLGTELNLDKLFDSLGLTKILDSLGLGGLDTQIALVLNALNPSALLAPGGFENLLNVLGLGNIGDLGGGSGSAAGLSDLGLGSFDLDKLFAGLDPSKLFATGGFENVLGDVGLGDLATSLGSIFDTDKLTDLLNPEKLLDTLGLGSLGSDLDLSHLFGDLDLSHLLDGIGLGDIFDGSGAAEAIDPSMFDLSDLLSAV